jgi:phage FluMu protein Com
MLVSDETAQSPNASSGDRFTFLCTTCDASIAAGSQNVGLFMDCPTCGNRLRVPEPEEAEQQVEKSQAAARYKTRTQTNKAAIANIVIGGLICVVGTVVTVGTFLCAANDGSFLIAWGAIVFGGIQFFKGLGQLFADPK